MVGFKGLMVLAGLVIATVACSSSSSSAPATPPPAAAAVETASASPSAPTPSAPPPAPPPPPPPAAPMVTDDEGDASQAHLDILGAGGVIDGDRLLATFHLAGLPEELTADEMATLERFQWRVQVYPEPGVPQFIIDIYPQTTETGTVSLNYATWAYEVDPTNPQNQPNIFWPAELRIDPDQRTIQVATRLPDLGANVEIQFLAYRIEVGQGQPAESDESPIFAPQPGSFALGANLPVPARLTAETTAEGTSAESKSI